MGLFSILKSVRTKMFFRTGAMAFFLLFFMGSHGFADILADQAGMENRLNNLGMLMRSIDDIAEEMYTLQKEFQSTRGVGREAELRERIIELSKKKEGMENSFNQLATDIDSEKIAEKEKTDLDWNKELRDLLGPVMREIKKITSHPREIERMRTQTEGYKYKLSQINDAIENLDTLLTHAKDASLVDKLNQTKDYWVGEKSEIETRLSLITRQLDRKLGQRKTFSESARELMQMFFKSRGRNLIVSLLAFVFTWVIFFYLHKPISKFSPIHKNERSYYARLFDVVYYALCIVISVMVFLAVLYFFADWVLLSIAAIFLLGVGWASKQAIPLVYRQIKLMLNFGPVREGEVLIYNGLAYEVQALNLYTRLENAALEGGNIRLPIIDLLDYRSRPKTEKEPWFPTRSGDWVKLSDQTHGKVTVQTPETVELELLGGASVTYRTIDFLSLSPMNLSKGFRLWITFGLDYAYQSLITSEIPAIFENEITIGLDEGGHGQGINTITVQFKAAGSISLELEVLADFDGSAASDFDILQRTIARICVDTCNRNNWVIPFNQVRVHMVPPSE